MSNNQKYIVLPGGFTCRPVSITTDNHNTCHATKLTVYDITEVMPEGETFDGVEVWQYRTNKDLVQAGVDKEIIWKIGNQELCKSLYADIPEATRIAIKPLKAIEPVKEVSQELKNEPWFAPTASVENKETVDQAADRYFNSLTQSWGAKHGFIAGANWQQSQFIEGIVGFVLEYMITNCTAKHIDFETLNRVQVLNMKSEIIKEYNNGKQGNN